MKNLTRFHKERKLRSCGVEIAPYPAAPAQPSDAQPVDRDSMRAYLAACDAWEDTVDAKYLELLRRLPPIEPSAAAQSFFDRCYSFGLSAGLLALNERVDHRYTALYELRADALHSVDLVDKAGEPKPEFLESVPVEHSFCQFVFREGEFRTSDSAQEPCLTGHPYQGVMVSYHGVPVLDSNGELYGSLCHFDVAERQLSAEEFAHLQDVAQVLQKFVTRRP